MANQTHSLCHSKLGRCRKRSLYRERADTAIAVVEYTLFPNLRRYGNNPDASQDSTFATYADGAIATLPSSRHALTERPDFTAIARHQA